MFGSKRTMHLILVMALIIAASLSAAPAHAVGPCGPFQAMDTPSANCRPAFAAGQYLRIVDGISFVWLRASPSSQAAVVGTALPRVGGFGVSGALGNPFSFDGYQWWWYVQMYPGGARGWVEQYSLTPETPSTLFMGEATHESPPTWGAPITATLRVGVPFAWLRVEPRSDSPFTYTLLPGATFRVMSTPSPVSDRYQYWWPVTVTTPVGERTGWLEQSSIAAMG